ncbi:MAG: bifunctional UDP-3-O-[3-hydroxymyristoyl] N-acetylglucosamine deacetylase/3-hydroxyacyl-ACP dehydratase [Gemmatimonadetes bacterium]|nr:MAG: bifunctional UDP-3-O-[3-hydroxymyristoyl] N-acetylglucosamine deacetylase/3-hydroxyacyl-ACP dehydratase [Gemmatimonadota bacterium]
MGEKQCTIGREVSNSGISLHFGQEVKVTFKPAPPNFGIRFVRLDLPERIEIPALIDYVVQPKDVSRRTTLRKDGAEVETVEHLLAAARALGIDNLLVELDSFEPPELDGSSYPFVQSFQKAGIVEQDAPRKYYVLKEPVHLQDGDGVQITALPHDGFRISFTIQYDHPVIGTEFASYEITPENFINEIMKSKTFALMRDIEPLKQMGLIKGGSLSNAIVIGDDSVVNEDDLPYENNSFVRHKILDLVGDLTLLGNPLKAHVIATRSGHANHTRFTEVLKKALEEQTRQPVMDIRQIEKIMPHRYPFLLVDRIVEMSTDRVVGIKNVTINEPFFNGHFPGQPVMPGVLIIEAMGQAGGVLFLNRFPEPEKHLVYFTKFDNVKFRKPVVPGDQLRLELELVKLRRRVCVMEAKAYVEDALVAEATLSSMVMDRN